MRKLIAGYYRLLDWLLAATVGIRIVPVTLQIIARFTELIPHWIWTEEMARFLFIWMVMLGAMVGIRDASHFEVDVWPELSQRPNALLRIVSNVFVLVFALVFIWYGIKFVQFGWNQDSELAEMPMTYIFVAWPLAFQGFNLLPPARRAFFPAARQSDEGRRDPRAAGAIVTRDGGQFPGRAREDQRIAVGVLRGNFGVVDRRCGESRENLHRGA